MHKLVKPPLAISAYPTFITGAYSARNPIITNQITNRSSQDPALIATQP